MAIDWNLNPAGADYFTLGSAIVTGAPLTISAWVIADSATTNGTVVCIADRSADNSYYILGMGGAQAGDPAFWNPRSPSQQSFIESSTGYTAGQWHHICGVSASTTSHKIYLDGGGMVEGTAETIPTGLDGSDIGRLGRLSATSYFDGKIAEVAIWDVGLSANEVLALANGIPANRIRAESLQAYYPMLSEASAAIDYSGNKLIMTAGGANAAAYAHPPIQTVWGADRNFPLWQASFGAVHSLAGMGGLAGEGGMAGRHGGMAG